MVEITWIIIRSKGVRTILKSLYQQNRLIIKSWPITMLLMSLMLIAGIILPIFHILLIPDVRFFNNLWVSFLSTGTILYSKRDFWISCQENWLTNSWVLKNLTWNVGSVGLEKYETGRRYTLGQNFCLLIFVKWIFEVGLDLRK